MNPDKQLLDKFHRDSRDKFVGIYSLNDGSDPKIYCNTFTVDEAKTLGQYFEWIRVYLNQPDDKLETWRLVFNSKEEDSPDAGFRRTVLKKKRTLKTELHDYPNRKKQ